jgi:small ligand-binding sensory domain FIST
VSHGTSYKRRQLGAMMSGRPLPAPLGTLVFSCNGRGSNLFPEDPAYDARTVSPSWTPGVTRGQPHAPLLLHSMYLVAA